MGIITNSKNKNKCITDEIINVLNCYENNVTIQTNPNTIIILLILKYIYIYIYYNA